MTNFDDRLHAQLQHLDASIPAPRPPSMSADPRVGRLEPAPRTRDISSADLEAALGRTFSTPVPPRSRSFIDLRLEGAIASEITRRTSRNRGRRSPKPPRRMLVGVAAALLLTGTVAAAGTLFSQLIGGAPLLESVWDRATEIGQSTTDSGYTIILERAAADPERVWVAISANGADPARMRVTDAKGVVMDGGVGVGDADARGVTATLFGFRVPDGVTPSGPFTLEVTSVMTAAGETRGRWVFTFDVPIDREP